MRSFVEGCVLSEAEQSAAGESVTFEQFYVHELEGQVRRCLVLTRSNETATDIVHDAMTEVFRRWSTIDNPGAYLNRAVLNRCRDHARRSGVAERAIRMVTTTASAGAAGDSAESVALQEVLQQLPFNHRAALVLRYFGGLTTDEIASALSCRPGSVGPWISRGLATLRKELS